MDPFLGQMLCTGFDFAPFGWQPAAGQLLPISQYTALFSLIGTSYGGDGRSTFQLPNMQGDLAISSGTGPGLSSYDIGQTGGTTQVTLTQNEMGAHTHQAELFEPRSGTGNATQPGGNILAPPANNVYITGNTGNLNTKLSNNCLSVTGSQLPQHNNLMPYLILNWVICMSGIFPSRG